MMGSSAASLPPAALRRLAVTAETLMSVSIGRPTSTVTVNSAGENGGGGGGVTGGIGSMGGG